MDNQYVDFKLINSNDFRIYLAGYVDITTIDDDEPEFEYEQNDGTFHSHIPHYWKVNGQDLSFEFDNFIGTIDWDMFSQYLYDFRNEDKSLNFYGNLLIINEGADKSTTIRVKETTKIKLDNIGERGESFNDIINKLIKHYLEEE